MVENSRAEIYYCSQFVEEGVSFVCCRLYFMGMGVLPACICVPCACLVPMEARKAHTIPTFGAPDCV